MNLRDYGMALNVVRIWLQSNEFSLCYTKQLIATYELEDSFFATLIGLNAIESHYSQPDVFKAGSALGKISAKSIIDAILNNSPKTSLPMEELLRQLLAEIIKPIVFDAVREAMQGVEPVNTIDLPVNSPKTESPVEEGYLDKKRAAHYLGIGENTLNAYVFTGRIKGEKIGALTFFHKSDLDAYKNSLQRKPRNTQ